MEHSRRPLKSGEGLVQIGCVLASDLCLNDHIRRAACEISDQLKYLLLMQRKMGESERNLYLKMNLMYCFSLSFGYKDK